MWMAIIATLGPEAESTITVEMKTNFVSALVGAEDFRCTASILKAGRSLIYGTADCRRWMDSYSPTTLTYFRRDR